MKRTNGQAALPNTLQEFNAEVNTLQQKALEQDLNKAAGRQGMNGPARKIRDFDGSPLFGESQRKLF
jgi:hypothetical protein